MKKKIIFFSILVLISLGIGFLISEVLEKTPRLKKLEVGQCPIRIEEKIVRGSSLTPLIKSGQTIKVLFGYYDCHSIERKDVVAYYYAGNENPIIKIVKGLPGDSYELKEADSGEWYILINSQILRNSEDKPYLVSGNRYKMLSLYEDDCQNGIPQNTYLILGNLVEGSLDATRFGFVDKSDILGKVEY